MPAESNPVPMTAPFSLPIDERHAALTATVQSGVASKYWLELKPYPSGSARSLWLMVGNSWKHLDNPNDGTQIAVQNAFCNCPKQSEVVVWYSNSVVVGLVVRSQ